MSYPDILNKKGTIPIIVILLLGSAGLGITNTYSDSQFTEHLLDESPHLGTKIKLDHISQDISELKYSVKELITEIQLQKIILCSQSDYHCN